MYVVISVQDNDLQNINCVCTDYATGKRRFLEVCATAVSGWDKYTQEDIDEVLDNGIAHKVNGAIMFLDLTNCDESGW